MVALLSPTASPARAAHLGPQRRRPLILDAAFEVFIEHGYEGASMAAIARRAGVSKPVVYACFQSKGQLFTELLEREERRILGQIAAALPAEPGADPERTLVEGLTGFLRAVAESPDAYRVIYLAQSDPVAARVQRGRAMQVDAVAALVAAWLGSRGTPEPDRTARLMAHALVGAAEAAARALLVEPDLWDAEEMGQTLAQLIARGQNAV
ncbi:MAG: TetR/AcrR family transcriptional regulator [Solirubrobacteraceae bacterium]|nr:MAG: TetR/AcrR family transcriptional regulator [Solirubrobacterales bacterium]